MIRRRALFVLLALSVPATARAQGTSDAAVKAAFIGKFGAYVAWPATAGPITICAVGPDALGERLEQGVAGQQIDGRDIVVRRIDSVDRDSGCDIAYVSGTARQVSAALVALRTAPVLTVTDSQRSIVRGMVHFQIVANRVRFHIDDRAAAESRLGISSKLLALAISVRPRGVGR